MTSPTMQPRTYGAISMGSVGNYKGTYPFMSLLTWKWGTYLSSFSFVTKAQVLNINIVLVAYLVCKVISLTAVGDGALV